MVELEKKSVIDALAHMLENAALIERGREFVGEAAEYIYLLYEKSRSSHSSNFAVEEQAVDALICGLRDFSNVPGESSNLMPQLAYRRIRERSVQALAGACERERVRIALIGALEDSNEFVRAAAVSSLSKCASIKNVRAHLINALSDVSSNVREEAIRVLSSLSNEHDVRNALLALLNDKDVSIRQVLAKELAQFVKHNNASEAFLNTLSDNNWEVRLYAIKAFAKEISSEKIRKALIEAMSDPNEDVQVAAAKSLSHATNYDDVITAFIDAYNPDYHRFGVSVSKIAEEVLLKVAKKKHGIAVLINALRDQKAERDYRQAAALILADVCTQRNVKQALFDTLNDSDVWVRITAACALIYEMEEGTTVLVDALNHSDILVRSTAAKVLGSVRKKENVMIALILALYNIDNYEIRKDLIAGVTNGQYDYYAAARRVSSNATKKYDGIRAGLIQALSNSDARTRLAAITGLSCVSNQEDVRKALTRALEDSDTGVRKAAEKLLSDVKK